MIDTNNTQNKKSKVRLDQLIFQRGLASSRTEAQALILAGMVKVNDKVIDKAGSLFCSQAKIDISANHCPYVSRGGLKLEHALNYFSIDVTDKVCMDVGASTGGFTHCLLSKGAKKIYAVDVGYGQLHWKLRGDERVINIEKTNVRYLKRQDLFDFNDFFDIITIDTSFISLRLVIPSVLPFSSEKTIIISLIKPQFEAGREKVQKGGIVKDFSVHQFVIENIREFVYNKLGLEIIGIIPSPISGAKGNKEFLMVFNGKRLP